MKMTDLIVNKSPKKQKKMKIIINETQLKRLVNSTKNILENEKGKR